MLAERIDPEASDAADLQVDDLLCPAAGRLSLACGRIREATQWNDLRDFDVRTIHTAVRFGHFENPE